MARVKESPSDNGLAWAGFYLAHRRQLGAYAFAIAGSAPDAQDLLQDVLLRMIARRRPAENSLAYVLRSMRDRAIDLRRARTGRAAQLPADLAALIDVDAAEARETAQEIRAALARLRSEYREVIVLKVYCELSFQEVAEVLELPPGTAASQYRRGLAELEALLKEVGNHAG